MHSGAAAAAAAEQAAKLFRISVEFAEKLATPDATVCDAYAVLTVITKGIHDGKELVIEKTTPVVHHSASPEWECDFNNRRFGLNDEAVVLLTIFDDQPYRDPICLGQVRLDASDTEVYQRGFLDEVREEDEVYKKTLVLKKPDLRYNVKGVHKQDASSKALKITGSVTVSIEQEPALESQCGWLQRRINRMAEVFVWRPCWAVLYDNLLVIYEGRTEELTKKPLQTLALADVSGVSYNGANDCFELITFGVGRHFFKCHDDVTFQVRRSWIRKLRRLSAQIPNNEFVSEEVTHDKYLTATRRLARGLENSGVRVRALEPAPPHVLAMRAAAASLSPKKRKKKLGGLAKSKPFDHHAGMEPPTAAPFSSSPPPPSLTGAAGSGARAVATTTATTTGEATTTSKLRGRKDTVEVLKYSFDCDCMHALSRKLRKSISDRRVPGPVPALLAGAGGGHHLHSHRVARAHGHRDAAPVQVHARDAGPPQARGALARVPVLLQSQPAVLHEHFVPRVAGRGAQPLRAPRAAARDLRNPELRGKGQEDEGLFPSGASRWCCTK